jgi:Holliday junction resolvasome RuvABC endonuclease subunit
MYALGLDPNTKQTGWCAIYMDGTYESGVIECPDSDMLPWEAMAREILIFISDNGYDFVAIEGVYQGKNPKVTLDMARLVGAIKVGCWLTDETIAYELPTATIDRALGILGDRKRGNRNLGEMIIGEGKTEHEYDAWAVLHVGMGVHKENGWKKAG